MQYEVEKFGRGTDSKWFGFGARRFSNIDKARDYFFRFAAIQADVLSNGIRIDMRERKDRRVIATVGGRLDNPTEVREIAAENRGTSCERLAP